MSLNPKLELNLAICFITWAVTSFLHVFVPIYSEHCNNHTVTNIILIDLCTFKEGHVNHHLFFVSRKVMENMRCFKKKNEDGTRVLSFFFFFNWSIIALQCCLSSHWTTKRVICMHTYISFLNRPPTPPAESLLDSFIYTSSIHFTQVTSQENFNFWNIM